MGSTHPTAIGAMLVRRVQGAISAVLNRLLFEVWP
jgi:hypothetical protein